MQEDLLERYVFAVGEEPVCLWGYDLARENERFLRSFDATYFDYIARLHLDQLDGDNTPKAAVALRAAYHHGLEALFSLLGALSQAPEAVAAWIPRCSNNRLRSVVRNISTQSLLLTQRGRQRLSWQALSEIVHSHVWLDEEPRWTTATRFAELWSGFAADFLNPLHAWEYNSIKHGFRVSSGGSVLRIGIEPSFGVSPSESEMETMGASPHGTNFSTLEPIPATDRKSPHVRLMRQRLNWRAEAMVQALQLVSWSINNVAGFLRVLHGAPAGSVQFHRPEDPEAFEGPWAWHVGVISGAMNFVVDESKVSQTSKAELLAELEGRSGTA